MVLRWLRRRRLQKPAKVRIKSPALSEDFPVCQEYCARGALRGNRLHADGMTASWDIKEAAEEEEELAGKLEHMLLVIMISSQVMVRVVRRMEAMQTGS